MGVYVLRSANPMVQIPITIPKHLWLLQTSQQHNAVLIRVAAAIMLSL